jgi:hypothetical protein
VFINNEMPGLFYFFPIVPSEEAPSKFGQKGVLQLPGFKIKGTPNTFLFSPKGPGTLKQISPRSEDGVRSLEALIIFVDFLITMSDTFQIWAGQSSHFDGVA